MGKKLEEIKEAWEGIEAPHRVGVAARKEKIYQNVKNKVKKKKFSGVKKIFFVVIKRMANGIKRSKKIRNGMLRSQSS